MQMCEVISVAESWKAMVLTSFGIHAYPKVMKQYKTMQNRVTNVKLIN